MFKRYLLAAAVLGCSLIPQLAMAQSRQCQGTGERGKWGSDMVGAFPVASGQSCFYGFPIGGEVQTSSILQAAQHGTVKMLNKSTVEYTAPAGFKGKDTFKIQATGEGPDSRGTSILTLTVDVQ